MRKLTQRDHEKVWPFIQKEASKNLFIIGDIEVYGYEQDFQELWGAFDAEENLTVILLRYYESFIVYGVKDYDVLSVVAIMKDYNPAVISGSKEVLKRLESFLPSNVYSRRDTFFAECTKESLDISDKLENNKKVKIATLEDALRIARLENQIVEFESVKKISLVEREKQIRKKLESKAGRTYFIENGNEIVSAVSTTAENSVSAMIMGVCTKKEFRKQGFVSVILPILLKDLFKEKETACLFYDNPKAGDIYKRNGFKDVGIWRMLIRK